MGTTSGSDTKGLYYPLVIRCVSCVVPLRGHLDLLLGRLVSRFCCFFAHIILLSLSLSALGLALSRALPLGRSLPGLYRRDVTGHILKNTHIQSVLGSELLYCRV